MSRTSYSAEKTRIQKEMQKLEKKMQQLKNKQRKPVITGIVRSMHEYDITPEEIAAAFNRKSSGRKTAGARKTTVKAPIPPKYKNPQTGATWSGRGKAPRWIADAEASGISRETFAIDKPAIVGTVNTNTTI